MSHLIEEEKRSSRDNSKHPVTNQLVEMLKTYQEEKAVLMSQEFQDDGITLNKIQEYTRDLFSLPIHGSILRKMVFALEDASGRESQSFRIGVHPGVCRFCGDGLLVIENICIEPECQEHIRNACPIKLLDCGHLCGGIKGEVSCLPCLYGCGDSSLKQDADDMCMICFTDSLARAPTILLNCGHAFHLHCCQAILSKRWTGPRIVFGFSFCPICKDPMGHPVLKDLLDPIRELENDVKRKALRRLQLLGLQEEVLTPESRFHKDPVGYAMERYSYYQCFKCEKAYYGGEARCDADVELADEYDPSELVCNACSDMTKSQMCPTHGTDFIAHKCRYCCSEALFFCFGHTHFCDSCHDDVALVVGMPKDQLPSCPAGPKGVKLNCKVCPLGIKHPPTGEEFALGCIVCRNADI